MRPRLVRNGQPDFQGGTATDLVHFERGQQAHDGVRHTGAHGGQAVTLRRLGVREAIQPPGHPFDLSGRLQASKPVVCDPQRLGLARVEEIAQADPPKVAAVGTGAHRTLGNVGNPAVDADIFQDAALGFNRVPDRGMYAVGIFAPTGGRHTATSSNGGGTAVA